MEQFTFSGNAKKLSFALIAVGIIALVYGIISGDVSGTRIWSNVLIDGFFFFAISLAAVFFLAVQYASEASWATVLKRVFEGVAAYLPIGAAFLVLVFIAGTFHWHHIYHWMDPEVYNPQSEHFDQIIADKHAYLNLPFFWIRTVFYLGVWLFFARRFRKRSLEEDTIGGTSLHFKNVRDAAIFLVFFGFTSSTASWDWIMSIDTHWFSTLFGWYVFSGMWVSGIVVMTLLALYLKKKGHLEAVNENHLHDMAKWMFAISFLWSYLWFSQFMLIWYSNIPEEVTYFIARIQDYQFLFFGMFLINFILPMLILMSRDSKRNYGWITAIGLIILAGHWVDAYLLVTPGVLKAEGTIGFLEVGMFLGFSGLFIFVVFNALTKAPLMVKHHPFLEESVHHHV